MIGTEFGFEHRMKVMHSWKDAHDVGAPSILRVIHNDAALAMMLPTSIWNVRRTPHDCSGTGHGQITEGELLKLKINGQLPDHLDVLAIEDMKEIELGGLLL